MLQINKITFVPHCKETAPPIHAVVKKISRSTMIGGTCTCIMSRLKIWTGSVPKEKMLINSGCLMALADEIIIIGAGAYRVIGHVCLSVCCLSIDFLENSSTYVHSTFYNAFLCLSPEAY